MTSTQVISEYRHRGITALLERLTDADGGMYRVTYSRRTKSADKAENEFLSFLPPSKHDAYKREIADCKYTHQNGM